MDLTIGGNEATLRLHSGNFLDIEFSEEGKGRLDAFNPCKNLRGVTVKVVYAAAEAGAEPRIISILLSR